jgi:predicted transcriptional regulator
MAQKNKLGDIPVSDFMNSDCIILKPNYSIKGTIEIFRKRQIGGAPVGDFQDKILGVISDYDLLIQAASKPLTSTIEYRPKVISVNPYTTLKEVLVIFYKQKLKWMPVVDENNFIQGIITRIDVLNIIATHQEKD